jgi:hypothetical protein
MTDYNNDDIFYFCSLVEFIARKTKNTRADIIKYFSADDIKHQLQVAEVNHCLSFEQVSDELIEKYKISNGNFDSVAQCKFDVPSVTSIGKVYQRIILAENSDNVEQTIIDVFSSFIVDEISNFNSSVYYRSPDYLSKSYQCGKLLA